jgi:hypothetical protein
VVRENPASRCTEKKLLQVLFALSPSRLAGHAAFHSPGVHLLLTETHVYAAAARYVHAAVAAGFTAGWYIEHKLVLTRHGEEHTASHPGPDNGLSGGEDAAHDPVRTRCTRIGRPEGARHKGR